MSSPLAASFNSANPARNYCLPSETITFTFASAPASADDVTVAVLETVEYLHSVWPTVTDRFVGGSKGRIRKRKLQVSSIIGAPLPSYPDPVFIRIAEDLSPAAKALHEPMPEPERVASHRLRLHVRGTIKGTQDIFEGQHMMNVEYPMSMVVPQSGAMQDPALGVLRSWADQWKNHKSIHRQFFPVPLNRRSGPVQHSEYDAWITAMTAAAQFASAGVVAMATGHGDDGDGASIAWCNSVPEDRAPPGASGGSTYRLDVDATVLSDGRSTIAPTGASRVKLHALDRLADALVDTPIRRILLHTCRVGGANGRDFVQWLADRLRVPVMGHSHPIAYDGAPGSGDIAAHYDDASIVRPRDEREWPIHRARVVRYPGAAPPRHGP